MSVLPDSRAVKPQADLRILYRLDDFNGRALRFILCFKIAFLLVLLPVPFLWDARSVTQVFIELLLEPLKGHLPEGYGEGFSGYWHASLTLAFVLSHPILFWYALDMGAPRRVPNRAGRVRLTVLASLLSFIVGIVVWYIGLYPLLIYREIYWNSLAFEILSIFNLRMSGILIFVSTSTVIVGFACEIPVLMAGMVWLRIASPERLAAWRLYVVLAAFIIGALLTPSPDAINQAVVAIPICLLYELGLLLARFVPAPNTQPTV